MYCNSAPRVVHIFGSPEYENTALVRIFLALACNVPTDRYELSCCFLGRSGPLYDQVKKFGLNATVIPWDGTKGDLMGMWRFWKFLHRSDCRLLHVHFGGRTVRALARSATAAPLVMHVHSRISEQRGLAVLRQRFADCDEVIATSAAVAASIVEGRSEVVYPGVQRGAVREIPDHRPIVIGLATRLVPLKGVSFALRAFSMLARKGITGFGVQIAGDGPERSALELETKELSISEYVTFLGWQHDLSNLSCELGLVRIAFYRRRLWAKHTRCNVARDSSCCNCGRRDPGASARPKDGSSHTAWRFPCTSGCNRVSLIFRNLTVGTWLCS